MRHSIKRISKSALSVILALMMVVSTMAVGMVTVGAATFTKVELVGNINGTENWTSDAYPFTLNGTTWELTITFTQNSTFKARANGNWDISFGANNKGDNVTKSPGTYKITIPDGASTNTDLTITNVGSGGSDLTYTLNDSNGNTSDFTKTSDGVYETTVTLNADTDYKYYIKDSKDTYYPVSYTHLTLPTNIRV